MENILTSAGIKDLLEAIKQYIIYVYPGFITLIIYRFAMSKSIEENNNTFIKSIIISYLYTLPFQLFEQNPVHFEVWQHFIIILLAIAVPIGWNIFIRKDVFKKILRCLRIKTEIYDNLMDIMFYKEDGTVWVRAYMDDQKIMYEGSLRHYESDINRKQQIFLSGYRIYNYNETTKKYEVSLDVSSDHKQWVRLLEDNISRMEFVYQQAH